jgi:hypothetical protein
VRRVVQERNGGGENGRFGDRSEFTGMRRCYVDFWAAISNHGNRGTSYTPYIVLVVATAAVAVVVIIIPHPDNLASNQYTSPVRPCRATSSRDNLRPFAATARVILYFRAPYHFKLQLRRITSCCSNASYRRWFTYYNIIFV